VPSTLPGGYRRRNGKFHAGINRASSQRIHLASSIPRAILMRARHRGTIRSTTANIRRLRKPARPSRYIQASVASDIFVRKHGCRIVWGHGWLRGKRNSRAESRILRQSPTTIDILTAWPLGMIVSTSVLELLDFDRLREDGMSLQSSSSFCSVLSFPALQFDHQIATMPLARLRRRIKRAEWSIVPHPTTQPQGQTALIHWP
jgi:hypothetical protein